MTSSEPRAQLCLVELSSVLSCEWVYCCDDGKNVLILRLSAGSGADQRVDQQVERDAEHPEGQTGFSAAATEGVIDFHLLNSSLNPCAGGDAGSEERGDRRGAGLRAATPHRHR